MRGTQWVGTDLGDNEKLELRTIKFQVRFENMRASKGKNDQGLAEKATKRVQGKRQK